MRSFHVIFLFGALAALSSAVEHWAAQFGEPSAITTCAIMESEPSGRILRQDGNDTRKFNFRIESSTATGECHAVFEKSHANSLSVVFHPNGDNSSEWNLKLIFKKTADSGAFELADWKLKVEPTAGFNVTGEYAKPPNATVDFSTSGSNGYKCTSVAIPFTDGAVVLLGDVRVLAFAMLDKDVFPRDQTYQLCARDSRTTTLVPIIVGAFLSALVIGVLIAYIIGRARARAQGYASV